MIFTDFSSLLHKTSYQLLGVLAADSDAGDILSEQQNVATDQ
jgi:hypothetical protein